MSHEICDFLQPQAFCNTYNIPQIHSSPQTPWLAWQWTFPPHSPHPQRLWHFDLVSRYLLHLVQNFSFCESRLSLIYLHRSFVCLNPTIICLCCYSDYYLFEFINYYICVLCSIVIMLCFMVFLHIWHRLVSQSVDQH